YGGNDGTRFDQETKGLSLGAEIIIATPGRFLSHLKMGHADLSRVSFCVLDEADRMLDMGFYDDILKIKKLLPDTCQTVMFSATMPDKIGMLAKNMLKNPVEIKIAVSRPAEKISQTAYVCHESQKLGIIEHLFKDNQLKRVIIFSSSKVKVKEINRSLRRMEINSDEMHADLQQSQRDDVMHRFKNRHIDVLVATDIVARGIDIDNIATVINYDVPHDAEDYIHRIGRTARADQAGQAITFVRGADIGKFMAIEKFMHHVVTKLPLPEGMGDAPEYKAQPEKKRTHYSRGKGRNDRNRKRNNKSNQAKRQKHEK
ncbi:MAG: DEAD/DEAH box helicase, partial [Prevotella sp.]|nr:DEAD/DEAH box helicase [Prevotella sp.]